MRRGQAHVVGVALMLGIAVAALGGLTLAVGTVIDSQTAAADAARVADSMDSALQPTTTTGPHTGPLQFSDGTLRTVERDLRVFRNGTLVASNDTGGLVFESGQRRVAFVGGATVRGDADNAWLLEEPPITSSERTDVLVVGAAKVGGTASVSGTGTTTVSLDTNVRHRRYALGRGNFTVAVETTTPGPFERYFGTQNATTRTRDLDRDGVPSVFATYHGDRRGHLVVHNLSLEVTDG